MERRKFLVGLGSASIGGSALLGSGAFSRVESHRDVTIQVAEDPDAYLGLSKCNTPNGSYVEIDEKGHLAIRMDEENPTIGDSPLGLGINSNSITQFDRVFQICNQGKEAACIWIGDDIDWPVVTGEYPYEGKRRVEFYLEDEPTRSLIGEKNRVVLGVGECTCVGVLTRSHGLDAETELLEALDNEIVIHAETDCFTDPECVAQEFHFLSSSRARVDNDIDGDEVPGTEVFVVDFDGDAAEANLSLLMTLPAENFGQVDAMAVTPDGDYIYFYDKDTETLGRTSLTLNGSDDVETGPLETLGTVKIEPGARGGVVLATFSQDGSLYVASQNSNKVYTVDTIGLEASPLGESGASFSGADMAFDAAGVLHLVSNDGNKLYTIDTTDGSATEICRGIDNLTGLAFTDGGTGNLLGSLSGFPGGMEGEIHEFDGSCSVVQDYVMKDPRFEDETYIYESGDMATGRLCVSIQERY